MAILHTPRTLASIARGMMRRRRALASHGGDASAASAASRFAGFAPASNDGDNDDDNNTSNAHVYKSRANPLWDIDYLGHMNNASYLTHAEYARWEWTSENGALQHMYKTGAHFVVSNTSVRFRKEISLADTAFEIHSVLEAIDERHFWMHQTFRSGKKNNDKDNDTHSNSGNGRIMAQVLVQAVAVRNRKVVDPRTVLDAVGVPGETVDSLLWEHDKDAKGDNDNDDTANTMGFMQRFKDLDTAFREEANADDKRLLSSTGN